MMRGSLNRGLRFGKPSSYYPEQDCWRHQTGENNHQFMEGWGGKTEQNQKERVGSENGVHNAPPSPRSLWLLEFPFPSRLLAGHKCFNVAGDHVLDALFLWKLRRGWEFFSQVFKLRHKICRRDTLAVGGNEAVYPVEAELTWGFLVHAISVQKSSTVPANDRTDPNHAPCFVAICARVVDHGFKFLCHNNPFQNVILVHFNMERGAA